MKYLVLLAVVVIAYLVWRNNRLERRPPEQKAPPRAGGPQEMVSCAACGLHLPRTDALPDPRGDFYCCEEHRRGAGR